MDVEFSLPTVIVLIGALLQADGPKCRAILRSLRSRHVEGQVDLVRRLHPVQKLELPRSMAHHLTTLAGFGLIVAAGSEPLRLRSEQIEKPFTIDAVRVLTTEIGGGGTDGRAEKLHLLVVR